MTITTLTQSTNTNVYFKVALGNKGESKKYSKVLTKELFNQIAKSLKEVLVYVSVQSNKETNYKTLNYEWLNISDIDDNTDIQKELFVHACELFRNSKYSNKDNVNITIHTDKLPKALISKIQWQDIKESNPFE